MAQATTVQNNIGSTSLRYHELHLLRWLNSKFLVREGYAIPVIFAKSTDAFAHFSRLWSEANNPFQYLLNIKDSNGTPLYDPHPTPVKYPLISVSRKSIRYRPGQNYSIHQWRHLNWPTVNGDVTRCDLGNVTVSRRPQAFDYRYQIDHWCMRPDTQAFFIETLIKQMWMTGGTPQVWIPVTYPGYGEFLIRAYIDGDIEDSTPEEPEDGHNVEFRTTFSFVIEGYAVDVDFKILPALWTLITRESPDAPSLTDAIRILDTIDLRIGGANPTMATRTGLPESGPDCSLSSILDAVTEHVIYLGNPEIPQTPPDNWEPVPQGGYPGGSPPANLAGVPTVVFEA